MCTTGERSFVPEASGGGALPDQSDRSVNSLLAFKTKIIIIYMCIFTCVTINCTVNYGKFYIFTYSSQESSQFSSSSLVEIN